jgi:LacI family transcriptional regulator
MRSMRDVARLAEVSIATVSAVINEKGTVSKALEKRVLDAMEALDYQPDQIARSLRVGRSNVIGMIVPDVSNSFYAEVLRGVEASSERRGYSVILCDSNEDSDREQRHLKTLYSRRVDGVLLASSISQLAHDRLTIRRFPMVFLDAIPNGIEQGAVLVDNLEGAYMAVQHLTTLGHTRIGIIGGRLDRSVGIDRLNGYRKAMQEAGLSTPEELIRIGDFHDESGFRSGHELMSIENPPTAIFSCNNRMTLGLLRCLSELGIGCPTSVSVVSFDDADWATSFTPRLTCIAQPTYKMGEIATEMLLDKIEAKDDALDSPRTILRAELRIRESTAPCHKNQEAHAQVR